MNNRVLLSPADDTASRALVNIQTATTRVKELVSEGVSKGWTEKELTDKLNKAIAAECARVGEAGLREQVRKSLVTAARKWHYELSRTYDVLNRNLARQALMQPLNIDLHNLMRLTPYEKEPEFRRILDDGTNPGIPVIRDYQKSVRLAVRAISADPPKIVTTRSGKSYVMPVRLRAELAVRYAAAVENLQRLIDEGVLFCWISSHANCSPRCAKYQGRLYSLFRGKVTIDGKEYGESGSIDGISYSPINEALAGPNGDGNGCISGYNCRHRAIEYERGSRAPEDFTEAEIKREYEIDKKQRAYENQIRQLKTEERQLRACGMEKEAAALRKKWQAMTTDYQIYSMEHDRAYYPYRCVIDRTEANEQFELNAYLDKARTIGHKKQEKHLTDLKNSFIMKREKQREPTDFVSAKTVQEAEQYMTRRALSVSYKGITNVKSLNQVNRTYAYLAEKYGIERLDEISTSMVHKKAWAEAHGNLFHVSRNFANNPRNEDVIRSTSGWTESRTTALQGWEKELIKRQKKLALASEVDLRTCKQEVKDAEEKVAALKEDLKYSRHNVCYEDREVESIITHETGHIIAQQKFQQLTNPQESGGKAEKVYRVFQQAKESGDIYKISRYASKNAVEFFAECFTIYELEEERLPDYIQEMLKEVLE
ncbi:MAG: hypothetical protein IJ308_04370 [Clostridia bacterium]|nr:hypothetical protein [Clostridia bacterium]